MLAVINLFRLLDADPQLLGFLRGQVVTKIISLADYRSGIGAGVKWAAHDDATCNLAVPMRAT